MNDFKAGLRTKTESEPKDKSRNGLKRALLSKDPEVVRDYISSWQEEYYTADEFGDMYEDFDFVVPNYDVLLEALGMQDNQEVMLNYEEAIDDSAKRNSNKIDVLATDTPELYFVRMEQFGGADEDAAITRIIFTQDLEKAIEDCKVLLSTRDIVAEARAFYEKQQEGTTESVRV